MALCLLTGWKTTMKSFKTSGFLMKLISIWMQLWLKEIHVTGTVKNLLLPWKGFTWCKSNSLACYKFNRGNWSFLLWRWKWWNPRVNSVHYLDIKKNVIIDQKDVIRSKIFEFVVSFFKQIHCVKIIIKISWVKIYVIHVYINKNAYIVLFDKFSQKLFKVKTVSISMWQPEY